VSADPQAAVERRIAARHLLAVPLMCKEHDPDTFRLVRRHETELDRWFTQRLGYRLHLTADTARLFKSAAVPADRPLRTGSGRPFHHLEYVLLVLVVASTVSGPAVISLRELVDLVRTAAVEADVALAGDATERRAVVTAVRWLVDHGMAAEVHEHVDAYALDAEADAVLRLRPDRVALLAVPALAGATVPGDLLDRTERREQTRQFLRALLVEDPVVYREDLGEAEWTELRRRLGEEERYLDEMFGLVVEARAEGVSAVDPTGSLSDVRFPAGGTVGHAALLLIDALRGGEDPQEWWRLDQVASRVAGLARDHARHWSAELVAAPERLARDAVDLLAQMRCAEWRDGPSGDEVRLLPAAGRFATAEGPPADQDALW